MRPAPIGTATGFVNIGGFGSSPLAVLLVGTALDLATGTGAAYLSDYRFALASQGLLFAIDPTGLAVTLRLPNNSHTG